MKVTIIILSVVCLTHFYGCAFDAKNDRNQTNEAPTESTAAFDHAKSNVRLLSQALSQEEVLQTAYNSYYLNEEQNLLQNPGFESGTTGWSSEISKGIIDKEVFKSGTASFRYERKDPNKYDIISQSLGSVSPGDVIHFSGWVKGKDIATKELNSEKGAGVFVQGYNAVGKYIHGEFSTTLSGTFDWTYLKGIYVVPQGVSKVAFRFFLRSKSTGTVWFDDFLAYIEKPNHLIVTPQNPYYRGYIFENNRTPWTLEIQFNDIKSDDWILNASIVNGDGKQIHKESAFKPGRSGISQLSWQPTSGLSSGKYKWVLSLEDQKNTIIEQHIIDLTLLDESPEVYIDREGFTVKGGRRIFPLGIYLGEGAKKGDWANSDENLGKISAAGFNTVLSYYYGNRNDAAKYFATARQHNLNVVYNLKDIYDGLNTYRDLKQPALSATKNIIERYKGEPNLLAWYINDELGLGKISGIAHLYEQLKELDINHPAFQVENKLNAFSYFYNFADVFGSDPYPVEGKEVASLNAVTNWTNQTVAASKGKKGVWQVVQMQDMAFHKKQPNRPPTLDEMRNMSYQAIIGGAKGLFYFAYHWLWNAHDANKKRVFSASAFSNRWTDVESLMDEINNIVPVILNNDIVELKSDKKDNSIQYKCWRFEGEYYLMISNTENKKGGISINVPSNVQIIENNLEGMSVKQNGNVVLVDVKPFGSGVIKLK